MQTGTVVAKCKCQLIHEMCQCSYRSVVLPLKHMAQLVDHGPGCLLVFGAEHEYPRERALRFGEQSAVRGAGAKRRRRYCGCSMIACSLASLIEARLGECGGHDCRLSGTCPRYGISQWYGLTHPTLPTLLLQS